MEKTLNVLFLSFVRYQISRQIVKRSEFYSDGVYFSMIYFLSVWVFIFCAGVMFVLEYAGLRFRLLGVGILVILYSLNMGNQFTSFAKGKNFVENEYNHLKDLNLEGQRVVSYQNVQLLKLVFSFFIYLFLLAVVCYLIRPYSFHLKTIL